MLYRVYQKNMWNEAKRFDNTAKTIFAPIYPTIAQQIVDRCGVKEGFCIDVGSGPASLAMALAKISDLTVYALDISKEMCEIAKENIEAERMDEKVIPMLSDVQEMPFGDNSADLITSRGSMFFWQDEVKAFKEIYRVLKPNAMAYIGGGFGTVELKEKIAEKMRERDQNWESGVKGRLKKGNVERLEKILSESKIRNCRIIHDASGLWSLVKK